jgi:exosortase E/protease (VPEID-CTERM system)
MTLGTARFSVQIAPQCSGFEGAGLILAFGIVWLCLFRKESRFPQAFFLLPAGVATVYLLNAVRITALILIGNAGAEQIAVGGFHSQAGWIAFNVVALGFSVAARRVSWFNTVERTEVSAENPTATYLVPFLSILTAGMIAAAASAGFEWLYPIRFLAAGGVLWICRREYAKLDWSFSWFGPTMGVLVFAMWIALDALVNRGLSDAIPQALAASTAPARTTWIVFRTLAAITTVPIAEELVFRGYFIRRLISPVFESLPLHAFTWLSLATSSVAFGLLHGNLWFAGIVAGLLYGWALLRRGRIGEAVIAHATTNALLAAYVLIFHHWHLW